MKRFLCHQTVDRKARKFRHLRSLERENGLLMDETELRPFESKYEGDTWESKTKEALREHISN